MNRQEWKNSPNKFNSYYKKVHQLLKEWKAENNITEPCVAHPRDDDEETRAYNEAHYERWGCEEDGTFIDGKYLIFMAQVEHSRYHQTGKTFSEEHKQKMSENSAHYWKGKCGENTPHYGKHHSDETKAKLSAKVSATMKVISELWKIYKGIDGTMSFNEFQHSLKNNNAENK